MALEYHEWRKDAADINKLHEISMTFHGYNVDGGKGFDTNALRVQFKS